MVSSKGKRKDKSKNKKVPFFERLGLFVTKNYRVILIIWLVIIGAAVYPMLRLQKVLSYNEMEFLPDNLEFNTGEDIFDELFPSNSSGATIIVVQSNLPISAQENIEYIETLTERIYQDYNESIYEFQSPLTVLEAYNNSFWDLVFQGKILLNETLYESIINSNQVMYETKNEIENRWDQIASLYLNTWFNISRTYFYGVYNTTLFDIGPDIDAYQIINLETNFSTNMNISSSFVDLVYNIVTANLPDPYQLNDQLMHSLALEVVNSTLFQSLNQAEGMSYQTYLSEVYPLLQLYQNNWSSIFYNQLTYLGTSIVNGTSISENLYHNTTLSIAYTSQENVLTQLQIINQTSFNSLDIKELILNQTEESIDLTSLIEEFASNLPVAAEDIIAEIEPLIPQFLENVYNLGKTPASQDVLNLTDSFSDDLINALFNIYPPPDTIDDVPSLFSQWVLSEDQKTSLILITYNITGKTIDEIEEMIRTSDFGIGDLAHDLLEEMNLENTVVYHTGDQYVVNIWMSQAEKDTKIIDIVTIVFVLVILLVIFTSAVAPLIPLIAIGSSILLSMAFLWFISFAMDIHFMSTLFLTVTSLGAGVDYCIFIFSRYNEERKKGDTKEQALITAIKFAGESVFHSGLTVMVGFGAMIIPNFPLLRILGISMCIGITFSILSALLIVPSIILLFGDAIWWPKFFQKLFRPQKWFKKSSKEQVIENNHEEKPDGSPTLIVKENNDEEPQKKKFILRFADFVTRNGLTITIATFLIAAPFIYFTFAMDTSTDFMGMLPSDFEGTEGRNILSENMQVGDPTPINLLFYNLNQSPLEYDVRYQTLFLINRMQFEEDHIKTVRSIVSPLGINMLSAIEGPFASYSLSFVGEDNRSMLIEVYLDVSPYSKEAEVYVSNLKENIQTMIVDNNYDLLAEGEIYILGYARSLFEIKQITDNSFPIIIPVVIIGVYFVLFIMFGSYFTPIRLIITITLSIAVTLGLLHLIFSVGLNVPIFWLLPIMLFSILMGLGLDYDIFLVSRIKEYYDKGMSNKEAIAHALDHTAAIITSCGMVMAAAYSSLLISQLWHLRELGFAFAIAIILDATVIRLIVVPAIMVLLEKFNWIGPKRLMRKRHHKTEDTDQK
ncbi:MAG: MMPL family transporter [Asgard group archaeon]|nr:MMPL family transporter [Asgard group archaeon]